MIFFYESKIFQNFQKLWDFVPQHLTGGVADSGWDGHGSVWRSKKVAGLRPTKSGAGLAVGWWDGCVGGQGQKFQNVYISCSLTLDFRVKKFSNFSDFLKKNVQIFKIFYLALRAKL